MKKPITRISFGLFLGSFWMKLKDVPIFLKRVVYTLRHGYPSQATWEIYEWHRCVMLETLSEFRKNLNGYPASYDDEDSSPEEQYAKWAQLLTRCVTIWMLWAKIVMTILLRISKRTTSREQKRKTSFLRYFLNITSTCGIKFSQVFLRYKFEFWP